MRRALPTAALVLAAMGLALCAFLALSKPGDVSIRDECRKGTLTTFVDPQPEGSADSLSGLDYGALCNEDARRRMTLVAVMGVGTLAALCYVYSARRSA